MSENKFIRHLQGKDTAKSVLEIKNQNTPTSFANMPAGTSNANDVYPDPRGDAVGVLKGSDNWKLDGQNLVEATTVYGDGRDLTTTYQASGATLWVNSTYTFSSAKRFNPNTKFVLKLCGHSLDSDVDAVVDFSLIITFGNTVITKTFRESIYAFNFCKEFVIDFAESNTNAIKVDANDTMQVQLLCSDATASATIYNGMTVFTALQRRVDGEAVASDKKTFDEVVQDIDDINDEIDQIQEDIDDLEEYVDDTFVRLDGESIMTGPLKMRATSSFQCAIAPYWDGVGFYKLNSDNSVTLIASIETPDGFVPWITNTYNIGSSSKKWKNLYLAGKLFVATLNNGGDLGVPANTTGTLATKADVDLAANSGRMITDQGVWYAKMYAATVAPAAEDGTNYADFSQVDGQGNPIIVTYNRVSGAWVQDQTITPPAEYDGYVPITSKIWDIAEQAGQQGGRILWNHQSKEFTPYPQIVSFDGQNITNSTFSGGTITNSTFSGTATLSGASTVEMPQDPTGDQIVNKEHVDTVVQNLSTKQYVDDATALVENKLMDRTQHVIIDFQAPTAANNYTWYRKYADNWVEQGGYLTAQTISAGASATQSLTFPITMQDTNYCVLFGSVSTPVYQTATLTNRTTTGGTVYQMNRAASASASVQFTWQVSGMAAEYPEYRYTTPGTYTLELDAGTYSFDLSAGGGGGAAALYSAYGNNEAGASGGTGAYGSFELTLASADTVTIVVGAGGNGATKISGTAASTGGGTTSISTTGLGAIVSLTGGGAGYAHATSNGDSATAGVAGTVSTTLVTHDLHAGAQGSTATTSSGTHSAGTTTNPSPYSTYGFGGSFSYTSGTTNMTASNGGDGYVLIRQIA